MGSSLMQRGIEGHQALHPLTPPYIPFLTGMLAATHHWQNLSSVNVMPYTETNPRKTSDSSSPLNDTVECKQRPEHYTALLSNPEFAETPWTSDFGDGRFFYLAGVNDVLRLLKQTGAGFLKTDGYLDRIHNQPDMLQDWSDQSGLALNRAISLVRSREIPEPLPTVFYKCVECMVGFELAIAANKELSDRISPFWVYEYMRIIPAVYNVRAFNSGKVEALRAIDERFDEKALEAIGQSEVRLLDELANGKSVTLRTATLLKEFVDATYPDLSLKEIRDRPGRKGLGGGPASELEEMRRFL